MTVLFTLFYADSGECGDDAGPRSHHITLSTVD